MFRSFKFWMVYIILRIALQHLYGAWISPSGSSLRAAFAPKGRVDTALVPKSHECGNQSQFNSDARPAQIHPGTTEQYIHKGFSRGRLIHASLDVGSMSITSEQIFRGGSLVALWLAFGPHSLDGKAAGVVRCSSAGAVDDFLEPSFLVFFFLFLFLFLFPVSCFLFLFLSFRSLYFSPFFPLLSVFSILYSRGGKGR